MLKICAEKEPALYTLLEHCEFLNVFYIDTRYPVHWPTNYTREKAMNAKEAAKSIAEGIKEILERKEDAPDKIP